MADEMPKKLAKSVALDQQQQHQEMEVDVKKINKKKRKPRKPPAVAWKKPKGMPKRPLSAYNLFFKERREALMTARADTLKTENKKRSKKETVGIGFANLARTIADKWQTLDAPDKSKYIEMASKEKDRYNREMLVWRAKQKEEKEQKAEAASASLTEAQVPSQRSAGGVLDDARIHPSQLQGASQNYHIQNTLSHLAQQRMNLQHPFLREFSASSVMPSLMQHHRPQLQNQHNFHSNSQTTGPQNSFFPDSWFELQQATTRAVSCNPLHSPHAPITGDIHTRTRDCRGDLRKMSPNNSSAPLQFRQLLQQSQHQLQQQQQGYLTSEGGGLKKPSASEAAKKSSSLSLQPNDVSGATNMAASAQSSSLRHLASKLDNDTIRFLSGFRFSNASRDEPNDGQVQEGGGNPQHHGLK